MSAESFESSFAIMRRLDNFLFYVYAIVVVTDVLFLIATAILMLKISKTQNSSVNDHFKREKKWFLILLKLCAVMFSTWPFELLSINHEFEFKTFFLSDIIKLYSSVVLFNILVLRDEARIIISRKYEFVSTIFDKF